MGQSRELFVFLLIAGYTIQWCQCWLWNLPPAPQPPPPRGRKAAFIAIQNGDYVMRKSSLSQTGDSETRVIAAEHEHDKNGPFMQEGDEVEVFDRKSVSDAEALLACRAYLQRKNRLGLWTRAKQRKALREQATLEAGYFWEFSQQSLLRNLSEVDITFNQGEDSLEQVGEEDEEVPSSSDDDTYQEQPGLFTEMPTGPNERSEIRSRVKKEQWRSADFRKRWYESRWGRHVKPTDETKKQLKLQTKLWEIPEEILDSPEFSKLSEEEIDQAISSYILSKRKRGASRKRHRNEKEQQQEQSTLETIHKHVHRDSLFSLSKDVLLEQQRKRSERAQKAYKTRIDRLTKEQEAESKPVESDLMVKRQTFAQKALHRIVTNLDANIAPSVEDIEIMMTAKRLSQRKTVLQRILTERFEVRGKLYPMENGPPVYVTEATVAQLGEIVTKMLRNSSKESSS